jgi:alpha-mannosidase
LLHIISHTHWDREWYLSFERFRLRLVDLMDHVLDLLEADPEFRVFHLDGQAVVLMDYLEIRPEARPRLERLLRAGRVLAGPWFLQSDFYLTGGESTVRNLLLGARICRDEFGVEPMPVGLVADQFGVAPQLPQILSGFGIRTVVFGRGYGDQAGVEFSWRGSDGTEVFAVHLAEWYNNAQRLPRDPAEAVEFLRGAIKRLECRGVGSRHLIMMNGVDHLEAQENLSPILREVNAMAPGFELRHSALPEAVEATRRDLPDLQRFDGELRWGDNGYVPPSTGSTRVHLKLMNHECEVMLARWAEPFAAFARAFGCPYDAEGALRHAWRVLLENHAHDSICGCSIDEVHFQMEARFRRVLDIARDQRDRALGFLAAVDPGGRDHHSVLVLFNARPRPCCGVVTVEIDLLPGERMEDMQIYDAAGRGLPFAVADARPFMTHVLNPRRLPRRLKVMRHTVALEVRDVPACGYAALFLIRSGRSRSDRTPGSTVRDCPQGFNMRNEHITACINPDGTLDVQRVGGGPVFRELHCFEDVGERGDEYISMRPRQDEVVTTAGQLAEVRLVEDTPLRQRVRVVNTLSLPACLAPGQEARSRERVPLRIESIFTLARDSRRIEVETRLVNCVKDHRLRLLFPTDRKATHAVAGGPFDAIRRPFHLGLQNRLNDHPFSGYVAITDDRGGLAVLAAGLAEYEVYPERATLAVTLLRCVDILGDMPPEFWDKEANENDYCPEAQCQRPYVFRYAIMPLAGGEAVATAAVETDAFHTPPVLIQIPWDRAAWAGRRHWEPEWFKYFCDASTDPVEPPKTGPTRFSFLSVDNPAVLLSGVKRPEAPEALPGEVIARVYHVGETTAPCRLSSDLFILEAERVSLAESPVERLEVCSGHAVDLVLGPKEIATVRLNFRVPQAGQRD